METERAPGSFALITRGPAGNAVRSNIAGMVQDGPALAGCPGLARAYVMYQSQVNEETVGKLTCVPQTVNAWKVAVVCTERGPWGSDQIVLDLFRSTWQVAPSS